LVIPGHLHIIQLNAAAKCQLNDAERRRLQGIFKAPAKTDRNNYLSRIADEAEEDLHHNNTKSAFRAVETLAGQKHFQPVLSCIHKADGTSCRSNKEVMQRWSKHFTAALNHLPATTSTSLESESVSAVPDQNARTDELTGDEVIRAIKKLKNGRAAGSDGIPPKLLKCAIGPVSRSLHSLFIQVWRSGIVPAD